MTKFQKNDYMGKEVNVTITSDCSRHELTGVRFGKIDEKVDWLVGCPVFVDRETKKSLGVGYECEVIEVLS